MSQRIQVATDQPYEVLVRHGADEQFAALVPGEVERIAIIHSPAVIARARRLADTARGQEVLLIEAPDGEAAKTPQFLTECWSRLARQGFTRSDLVVGVGGGATTDLAGFVAATWLRGVRLITVPTTVLGMVDAAVGGKTGINLPEGKNLVGAFHEPIAVLCDLQALQHLPPAEVRSGLAEVIKCGFIADPTILDLVESAPVAAADPGGDLLAELIARGIAVKAATVAGDLTEQGPGGSIGREALNYGHTLGHAIERHEQYRIRHGEAISIGMVFVAELAHRSGLIDSRLLARHRRLLQTVGLPTTYPDGRFEPLLEGMRLDKKSRGSVLRFVVLTGLASPQILAAPDTQLLRSSYAAIAP